MTDWPLRADADDVGSFVAVAGLPGLPVLGIDWPLPGDAADAGCLVSGHRLVFAI